MTCAVWLGYLETTRNPEISYCSATFFALDKILSQSPVPPYCDTFFERCQDRLLNFFKIQKKPKKFGLFLMNNLILKKYGSIYSSVILFFLLSISFAFVGDFAPCGLWLGPVVWYRLPEFAHQIRVPARYHTFSLKTVFYSVLLVFGRCIDRSGHHPTWAWIPKNVYASFLSGVLVE